MDGLFKCGYAIPLLQSGETCDCGYPYCPEVNMADCESTKMIIHHSKATKDSRNSSLVVLYRTTRKCDHKKFYRGADDQLLRVSAVVQPLTTHHHPPTKLVHQYQHTKEVQSQYINIVKAFKVISIKILINKTLFLVFSQIQDEHYSI